MRRRVPLLLLFCLTLLFALACPVLAAEDDLLSQKQSEAREGLLAILPDAAKPRLSDPTSSDEVAEAVGFRALFSLVADAVSDGGVSHAGRLASLFGLTLLFSALSLFIKDRARATAMLVECTAALCLFSILSPTLLRVFSFFTDLKEFSLGLSPVLVSLLAAGGSATGAGAASAGFSSFSALLSLFAESVFPPLLRMLFALALLSALGGCTLIEELSRRLSGLATLLFSILSMLHLASLAFESALAKSADSVALRTLKFTINSSIPVVGNTVSGSLSALEASLSLIRSAAGGSAVVALLSLLLPPLVEVFLIRVALSLCQSVTAFTGSSSLGKTLARFRGVLDLSLAALSLVSVLFLVTVGIFTRLSS